MGALVGAFGWESALKLPPELLEEQTRRGSDTPPRGRPQHLGHGNGEKLPQWLQWYWDTGAGGMQLMSHESGLLGPMVPCVGEKVFGRD